MGNVRAPWLARLGLGVSQTAGRDANDVKTVETITSQLSMHSMTQSAVKRYETKLTDESSLPACEPASNICIMFVPRFLLSHHSGRNMAWSLFS